MRRATALFSVIVCACASTSQNHVGAVEATASAEKTEGAAGASGGSASDSLPEGELKQSQGPDPKTLALALDRTATSGEGGAGTYGVRFEILEEGPELPWALAIVNRGTERVSIAYDPRLLRLEIESDPEPPAKNAKFHAKPKKIECALPPSIRPAVVEKKLIEELAPGEGLVETFDPRLYCLPDGEKNPLVPGARVTAHLGWPVRTKMIWKKGKSVEEVLPQSAPFVAWPNPQAPATMKDDASKTVNLEPADASKSEPSSAKPKAPATHASKGTPTKASADKPAEVGSKELVATTFTLGGEYTPAKPPADEKPPILDLLLSRGSDADTNENATISTQIRNRSTEKHYVFFRRELLSFEVSGPDGKFVCDPQPDTRSPDKPAFRLLPPGGSISSVSRLIELCPDDSFSRPGLYLVHGRFEASIDGDRFELDAVTGVFGSEKPALVRIRSGDLPFFGRRTMARVRVGSTEETSADQNSRP